MNKLPEKFDYEDTFMGVALDRSEGFEERVYADDHRLRKLMELVKEKKGRILEAGCGGGSFIESLAHFYPSATMYGCDISKTAISYAKKFGKGKVTYDVITKNKLPYSDGFFDDCVCLDLLEHEPDTDLFLKEIKRILKKDGLFFLAVPCEGQWGTLTWVYQKIKIGRKLTFKHFGHIHPEFTHKNVCLLLQKYGFRIVKKSYSMHLLTQIFQLFQYFLPKELLELIIGAKKAERYYDKSIVRDSSKGSIRNDLFMKIRIVWFKLSWLTNIISAIELKLMHNVSFTSWKLLVLAKKTG